MMFEPILDPTMIPPTILDKRVTDLINYQPDIEEWQRAEGDYFWYAVYDDYTIGCAIYMKGIGNKSPDNVDREKVKFIVLVPNPFLNRDRVILHINRDNDEKLILFRTTDILMGLGKTLTHYTVGWRTPTTVGDIPDLCTYCQISADGKIHVSSKRII